MDYRDEPVRHSIRRALPRNNAMTDGIMATSTIAWSAPSPSSPASSTRRCAALGLDRSLRPSKVADRAVDAQFSMYGNSKSTFTEISYTKLLTFPARSYPCTRLHARRQPEG